MSSFKIDRKRLESQLAHVSAARLDMEVRIAELNEALGRINKEVQIQLAKEEELSQKLKSFDGGEN